MYTLLAWRDISTFRFLSSDSEASHWSAASSSTPLRPTSNPTRVHTLSWLLPRLPASPYLSQDTILAQYRVYVRLSPLRPAPLPDELARFDLVPRLTGPNVRLHRPSRTRTGVVVI